MRSLAVLAGVALLALTPVSGMAGGRGGGGHGGGGRGGGGWHGGGGHRHGGWHGHGWHGSRVFVGPRVFVGGLWDPFYFPGYYPYYYPYYAPYPYPVYGYPPPPPPPPDDDGWGEAPPPSQEGPASPPPAAEAPPASYGLVQLRGIPDGAAIELDGRFWITARDLDDRWVALPDGEHTLTVKLEGATPVVRRIDVRSGKTQVVRFGPFPSSRG